MIERRRCRGEILRVLVRWVYLQLSMVRLTSREKNLTVSQIYPNYYPWAHAGTLTRTLMYYVVGSPHHELRRYTAGPCQSVLTLEGPTSGLVLRRLIAIGRLVCSDIFELQVDFSPCMRRPRPSN